MKISEKLRKIAESLTDHDSEILVSAERNSDEVLVIVAQALACAAEELIDAAERVESKEETIDQDSLAMIASLATEYDGSSDPELVKVASVLDEILLTIGAPKDAKKNFKVAEETELDRIRKKHRETAQENYYDLKNDKNVEAAKEAVEKIKEKVKEYRPMQHSLSTRYSPDYPGVPLIRVGDNIWQCSVTGKMYDFSQGYKTVEGDEVPGSSVSNQTQQLGGERILEHMNFSNREEILNRNQT